MRHFVPKRARLFKLREPIYPPPALKWYAPFLIKILTKLFLFFKVPTNTFSRDRILHGVFATTLIRLHHDIEPPRD